MNSFPAKQSTRERSVQPDIPFHSTSSQPNRFVGVPSLQFGYALDLVLGVGDHLAEEEGVGRVGEFEAAGAVEVAVVD